MPIRRLAKQVSALTDTIRSCLRWATSLKPSLKRSHELIGDARRFVANSAILLSICLAGYVLIVETRNISVTVEPIEVPETLEDLGFTPRVAAQYLIERVYEIQDNAGTDVERPLLEADWSTPDLVLPSGGLSIKSTAAYLRDLLGRHDQVVSGEVIQIESDDDLSLRLRVNGRRVPEVPVKIPVSQTQTPNSPLEVSIEELFGAGAQKLVFAIEPYLLASYYYEDDRPGVSGLLSHIRVNYPGSDDALKAVHLEGIMLYLDDRFDEAVEKYQEVVERDPQFARAYHNWGLALAGKGDFEAAIGKYRAAVRRGLRHAFTYRFWGNALRATGDYDAAIEKYAAAVKLDPEYAAAYTSWGIALLRKGEHEGAIEKCKRAAELDPESAGAYYNRGLALVGRREFDAGIAKYRRAAELDPEWASVYVDWGFVLAEKGEYDAAIEKYRRAAKLGPESADVYNLWGLALGNKGEYDAAIEKYRRAAERDPEWASVYHNWGVALEAKREFEAAAEKYEKAGELGFRRAW